MEKREREREGEKRRGKNPACSENTERELLFAESCPGMPRIKLLYARYARHHSSIRIRALVDVVIPQINTLPCPEPPSIKSGLPLAMLQSPTMRAPCQSFRYGAPVVKPSPPPSPHLREFPNKSNQIKR